MDILFFIALVVTSVIMVAFLVERGLALRWHKVIPPAVAHAVENYQSESDLPRLRGVADANPSALSRLLLFASDHLDWPRSENRELIETRARHEMTLLERGLVVLEIIVGIAPLLGLVGTIYGLITLFSSMGAGGTVVDSAKFAAGISIALYATLLGLMIAIPSLVGWSYYNKKAENLGIQMASLCEEFLRKHYRTQETVTPMAEAGGR